MTEQTAYHIRVQGWIADRWSSWFEGMTIVHERQEDDALVTTLSGVMADQAALRGTLNQLWDLNLVLLSVVPIDAYLIEKKGG